MADTHTPEQRKHNMRRIRSSETEPERRVRAIVHALGYRFRLYRKDLPGTPDLVFPRHRKVIFVHGCFWHQHSDCRYARLPQTRRDYSLPKLERNIARDSEVREALEHAGWKVLNIWQCQTRDAKETQTTLREFLGHHTAEP
jgi:DNA mismatch endonuclease (patch repair protein)